VVSGFESALWLSAFDVSKCFSLEVACAGRSLTMSKSKCMLFCGALIPVVPALAVCQWEPYHRTNNSTKQLFWL